ncbi:type I restriction endonuclease EcoAI subunit S [Betaproteobacteria bacterium]|nr:type I restriction endonuclease EcoAI subunit S [Betaproteobacteria bacterium]
MNQQIAELLERHFDLALSAPNGIQKLRELILTLAMRGELVPQDRGDPPARELLRDIEAEKKRLMKESKIKAQKPLAAVTAEEMPYVLPEGWEWVRLGDIAVYNGRNNIIPNEIQNDSWILDLEDIEKGTSKLLCRAKYEARQSKSTKSTFKTGDVLYGKLRPYLDKVIVADTDGVCTTEIVPIIPSSAIDSYFLRWLLKRPEFLGYVNSLMYGIKMPRLGTDDGNNSIHPLPPLPEQHRIVAKIDQLMSRCDALEKLRAEHEQKRAASHAAAMHALLNAPDAASFHTALQFIVNNFNDLYAVRANVTELRKAILQLAVMGKLVPQDPSDPPARELLQEIEAEKKRLMKEGKISAQKPLAAIAAEEMPYALPEGWEWVRLGELGVWKSGSTPSRTDSKYYNGNIPWVKSGEVKQGVITYTEESITELALDKFSLPLNQKGAVLLAMYGANIGEVGILDIEATTNQAVCACKVFPAVDKQYLLNLIRTLKAYFVSQGAGAAQPNISKEKIVIAPVPLPPLPEQHRIVAKVTHLMTLCDTLEQHITAATTQRSALLDAVVARVGGAETNIR